MQIQQLLKICQESKLITDSNDIDFIFVNYASNDESLPIDQQIAAALTWAYEQDALDDFYLEHLETLIDSGYMAAVVDCSIQLMGYETYYSLYRLESKNKYYYKVEASGLNHEVWDCQGFYKIVDKTSKKDIIAYFEGDCEEAFTNYDEFSYSQLIKEGHRITFEK